MGLNYIFFLLPYIYYLRLVPAKPPPHTWLKLQSLQLLGPEKTKRYLIFVM